jgi:hypothetical protein
LKQLHVDAKSPGDRFTLVLPAPEERYDVDLYYTKGPSYGDVNVLLDGRTLGTIRGFDRSVVPGGYVRLTDLPSSGKEIRLQLSLAGKDGRSTGFAVGVDAFTMRPHRDFIPAWSLIGPFPNPRDASQNRLGLDVVYGPEREFDGAGTYEGVGGQKVAWHGVKTPKSGRVDLYMFDPYEMVVAYAFTYVYSPENQVLPLLLGSDDGVKVFLNGKEIHRVLMVRVAEPDQDNVPLHLVKGWNRLLLKIENNFGGYNFFARIPDPSKSLKFNASKPE